MLLCRKCFVKELFGQAIRMPQITEQVYFVWSVCILGHCLIMSEPFSANMPIRIECMLPKVFDQKCIQMLHKKNIYKLLSRKQCSLFPCSHYSKQLETKINLRYYLYRIMEQRYRHNCFKYAWLIYSQLPWNLSTNFLRTLMINSLYNNNLDLLLISWLKNTQVGILNLIYET